MIYDVIRIIPIKLPLISHSEIQGMHSSIKVDTWQSSYCKAFIIVYMIAILWDFLFLFFKSNLGNFLKRQTSSNMK